MIKELWTVRANDWDNPNLILTYGWFEDRQRAESIYNSLSGIQYHKKLVKKYVVTFEEMEDVWENKKSYQER